MLLILEDGVVIVQLKQLVFQHCPITNIAVSFLSHTKDSFKDSKKYHQKVQTIPWSASFPIPAIPIRAMFPSLCYRHRKRKSVPWHKISLNNYITKRLLGSCKNYIFLCCCWYCWCCCCFPLFYREFLKSCIWYLSILPLYIDIWSVRE